MGTPMQSQLVDLYTPYLVWVIASWLHFPYHYGQALSSFQRWMGPHHLYLVSFSLYLSNYPHWRHWAFLCLLNQIQEEGHMRRTWIQVSYFPSCAWRNHSSSWDSFQSSWLSVGLSRRSWKTDQHGFSSDVLPDSRHLLCMVLYAWNSPKN